MCDTTCWNIRRFNLPHKQKEIQEFVWKEGIKLVSLLDIKIVQTKVDQISSNYLPGRDWNIIMNFMIEEKIWVCWDLSNGVLQTVGKGLMYITIEVQLAIGIMFLVMTIYASTDRVI